MAGEKSAMTSRIPVTEVMRTGMVERNTPGAS
jgi:hypothetical protein